MFVVIHFLRDCVILLTGTKSVQVLSFVYNYIAVGGSNYQYVWCRINTLPGEIHWSWYRMTLPGERHWLWYRMPHCQVKYTGCGTVCHIARWNTLVVVPYDILLGCTGRGTAWHITRWKALVVVLYDILPGEIHWLWYRIAHCHHDQCISPGIMSYDTTTSVFHLAMYYAVPRPVQPSNMLYGTTTSAVHLAMCHAVPWPVQPSNICHTVPQPVYYTWQCAMRYHNQCISPGNMSYKTSKSFKEFLEFSGSALPSI
jgi:hypothetical protein